MDSLSNLLANKDFDEPTELTAIKTYVQTTYHADVSAKLQDQVIVVMVQSASLAAQLRMNLPALQKAAGTDKRIVLRITN